MTDIQTRVQEIRAAQAEREQVAAAAKVAEETRITTLDQAKARCTEVCGPIADAIAVAESQEEKNVLIELEAQAHAAHAADLEAAYLIFADQREGESNPASPGVTQVAAEVVVASEASA